MLQPILITALLFFGAAAPESGVIVSAQAPSDAAPTADLSSALWKHAPTVFAGNDPLGAEVPGHKTEIRSRWTKDNLYILFICPYDNLFLKPNPVLNVETNKLWNWDVAEAFIGSDFQNIFRYKEFEVSPRGEWVDLDIDRKHPLPEGGVLWDSKFEVKTRIDEKKKVWYGEMKIPFSSIASGVPKTGQQFRVNFYRMQGTERKMLAWQPTHARNYHVPESFGLMKLAPAPR